MVTVTWPQVLAWRMRRQFVDPPAGPAEAGVVDIVRRLAGVQAQVPSQAELAIALRQRAASAGAVGRALTDDRSLVKTWAMRGTLHLLPADEAGAYLAVSGAHRRWEQASWQKAFGATPADLEAIADAARDALSGGAVLTRDELVTAIVERTGSTHLAEVLGSGWGTLLKPLAWWGVLCHGPVRGNRVTFVSPADTVPGWTGVPGITDESGEEGLENAARVVIRAYLGAYGPASPETFDKAWLSRGATRRAMLRRWFAALGEELSAVDVEGTKLLLPAAHVDELAAQRPSRAVRLVAGFDQYILGPGTGATEIVPKNRRAEVSRTAGRISPVVLRAGRVVGTWRIDDDDAVRLDLWEPVDDDLLEAEVARVSAALGRPLRIA